VTLIIPPGFGLAQYVFSSTVGTPPFVSTLGLDISAYGGDFVNAADHAMFAWEQSILPIMDTDVTLERVTLSVGQDGPGGSVDSTRPAIAGSRSGDLSAFAMAAVVRKVTNEIGRRGRGRIFLPAVLSDAEVDQSGSILPARASIINVAFDDLMDELIDPPSIGNFPMPPFLFHSQAPADPTPIIDFACADLVGWVRGRIR
jgi:hypothetical protein